MPDYKNLYNTELNPTQESQFKTWAKQKSSKVGRNVLNDLENYDLKGYWLKEGQKDIGAGHMPDTYKKPNHPTFSNESIYSNKETPGGEWKDNTYTPSSNMLKTTIGLPRLMRYMKENEPGVELKMPLDLKAKASTRKLKVY
jgi:hypothetical protein